MRPREWRLDAGPKATVPCLSHCALASLRTDCSVHGLGSSVTAKDHPDARAVFYETELYSKRRINDLLQVGASKTTMALRR